ncbi:hypothetical protein X754_17595 [Mesorhizobium sp. LNJC403B00]|nr:hypothetical protein X754_17595 [Mesorhizobium sp. LNJC403B00]
MKNEGNATGNWVLASMARLKRPALPHEESAGLTIAVGRQREGIHTERCDGRTFPFTRQFNNKYLFRIGRAILDGQYRGWLNG